MAAADGLVVKVIFETVSLRKEEVVAASYISKDAGAKFVKTCTGFMGGQAEVENVRVMKMVVGDGVEVKASGVVRTRGYKDWHKLGGGNCGRRRGNRVVLYFSYKPANPSSTTQRFVFVGACRILHAQPVTSSPGGRDPSSATAATTAASVVRITRWSGQLARSITAHGNSAGYPFSRSSATNGSSLCSAIKNTVVRLCTYAGKSGAAPLRPVPVHSSN